MKTPSFLELKTLVEYLEHELSGAQLQEVSSNEEGLVLSFYRFDKSPRTAFLLFDMDRVFPFLGFFHDNPWARVKKTKPVALFLNAHAKNQPFAGAAVSEALGRVVNLEIGSEVRLEFRLIPKQTNLIAHCGKKSISWDPVKELALNDQKYTGSEDENVRSIAYLMAQWSKRRGSSSFQKQDEPAGAQSLFEKWKKKKEKDRDKKQKALAAVQTQVEQYRTQEWALVGEHIKLRGLKKLKAEWSVYVDFEKSASTNMQACFEKAKAAKIKVTGAEKRAEVLRQEITALSDLTEAVYEAELRALQSKKGKTPVRAVEGRLRKTRIEGSDLVAYMGKSAQDNMDLLRRAKPHDLWLHLKDYPSAHAIIHRQKEQKIADDDLRTVASWLVKEGLHEKQTKIGGKFAVVVVECRHVKPLKGDKLGRVTYHNGREILIAI